MSVKVRTRKNKDGTISQYLDIYSNGKRVYENLPNLRLVAGKSAETRTTNKSRKTLANQIARRREEELQAQEYGITPSFKLDTFVAEYTNKYAEEYPKKDKRVVIASVNSFTHFLNSEGLQSATFRTLNENLMVKFKAYLETNLKGETPSNYFKKIKRLLQTAMREGLINHNPCSTISIKKTEGIKKDTLSIDEISLLASTNLSNEMVKKAFIFSCFTGLRFCDIIKLDFKHVNSGVLKITQSKTDSPVIQNLHPEALKILDSFQIKDGLVFKLPSHTACTKLLKTWTKNAGIDKKVTWHCARHSFATNLVFHGANVMASMQMMGQRSLRQFQQYVRLAEQLKAEAIQSLPMMTQKEK